MGCYLKTVSWWLFHYSFKAGKIPEKIKPYSLLVWYDLKYNKVKYKYKLLQTRMRLLAYENISMTLHTTFMEKYHQTTESLWIYSTQKTSLFLTSFHQWHHEISQMARVPEKQRWQALTGCHMRAELNSQPCGPFRQRNKRRKAKRNCREGERVLPVIFTSCTLSYIASPKNKQ